MGDRAALIDRLAAAGFVAADEEADELLGAAPCKEALDAMLDRRLTGEPLAWITGMTEFCGRRLVLHRGVYVPRPHTELVAERAAALRPRIAIDLCTGCGAVAAVLGAERAVGSDLSPRAVANARSNGVEAYEGDLFAPLPEDLRGTADVVTAVVPYVPTDELRLLHRDTLTFEDAVPYDGGPDGAAVLRRVIAEALAWLRPGGALVLELGGDEAALVAPDLEAHGFAPADLIRDADGDVRGIESRSLRASRK